jgi:hypothetical protein
MKSSRFFGAFVGACCGVTLVSALALAQAREQQEQFGPVVTAYLGYLKNEQEVVDDRVSRREISRAYYRRNSNRIRALREIAMRIARESHNDYLPELEAVAADELGTLFEHPPKLTSLTVGKVFNNTFRYLGSARTGEVFYVFARLDPYEQGETKRQNSSSSGASDPPKEPVGDSPGRPRRVQNP